MTKKIIDLVQFRGNKSTLFTGRPQGMAARAVLKLDEYDKNENLEIIFEIPDGTTSFNPSFYLGLVYHSYKNLGVEKFSEKYKFEIKTLDEETKKVLIANLADGMRDAINELNKKTGLWSFIKKKL